MNAEMSGITKRAGKQVMYVCGSYGSSTSANLYYAIKACTIPVQCDVMRGAEQWEGAERGAGSAGRRLPRSICLGVLAGQPQLQSNLPSQ